MANRTAKHIIGDPPVTLAHWAKWRKDAGLRSEKQAKTTSGVDPWDRYGWTLEGDDRHCEVCGGDILTGEQSIHPLVGSWNPAVNWNHATHPRCIEDWHQVLRGKHPTSKNYSLKGLRGVDDEYVQLAMDEGRLTPAFADWSIADFTDALRKHAGLRAIKREEVDDEEPVGSQAEEPPPAPIVSSEDPWMGRFADQVRASESDQP